MTDPEIPERSQDERRENEPRSGRRPFDISDLNTIPSTTDEDPPYRNWWVVDPGNR